MRRLITLISAGRNRIVVIRRGFPADERLSKKQVYLFGPPASSFDATAPPAMTWMFLRSLEKIRRKCATGGREDAQRGRPIARLLVPRQQGLRRRKQYARNFERC